MLEECSPEERTAIYKSMADTLAKIHSTRRPLIQKYALFILQASYSII
jgi:hypothetical protein